jgi:hypothetical protein
LVAWWTRKNEGDIEYAFFDPMPAFSALTAFPALFFGSGD